MNYKNYSVWGWVKKIIQCLKQTNKTKNPKQNERKPKVVCELLSEETELLLGSCLM